MPPKKPAPQHYMKDEIQQFYYDEIEKSSPGNAVDSFWLNLLPDYFPRKLKYGIEQGSGARTDSTVRTEQGPLDTQAISGSDTVWADALEQLTRGLKLLPEQDEASTPLYAVVNIGTHTRFYRLDPRAHECVEYAGRQGRALELAYDEAAIHAILEDLVEKTQL